MNQKAQGFDKKIKELELKESDKLEFWIKIIWEDKKKDKDTDDSKFSENIYNLKTIESFKEIKRESIDYNTRKELTINRTENIIQYMIWKNIKQYKK